MFVGRQFVSDEGVEGIEIDLNPGYVALDGVDLGGIRTTLLYLAKQIHEALEFTGNLIRELLMMLERRDRKEGWRDRNDSFRLP